MTRLERSLEILRALNDARARWSGWAGYERIVRLEKVLEQHDYDARRGVDARQTTIFEAMKDEAFREKRARELSDENAFWPVQLAQWCECSDALSAGIPCAPGTCPNAGKRSGDSA